MQSIRWNGPEFPLTLPAKKRMSILNMLSVFPKTVKRSSAPAPTVHDFPANNAFAFWNKFPHFSCAKKQRKNKDHIFSLSHPTSAVTGQVVRLSRYCFFIYKDSSFCFLRPMINNEPFYYAILSHQWTGPIAVFIPYSLKTLQDHRWDAISKWQSRRVKAG